MQQPQQTGQVAKHPLDSRTIISAIGLAVLTYFLEDTGRLVELLGEHAASKVAIIMGAVASAWRVATSQPQSLDAQSQVARLFARKSKW